MSFKKVFRKQTLCLCKFGLIKSREVFWHQLLLAFNLIVNKNNVSERQTIVILNQLKC